MLKVGDKAPAIALLDQNSEIMHGWYKISLKDTPAFLLEALEK
ncbi:MAG: hypothetical protein NWR84_01355 [Ilumatobacteraceae bacterium]|jgi:hypothetical protein|nr:hypothetical protein [Ilumatobacteraceae bacterium]MDP4851272.1 hypothetical protein [Ilumatobacteraceae bacterium]MDP5088299.1 hypothetical protein [Ilumatobacteraceae bacterium]